MRHATSLEHTRLPRKKERVARPAAHRLAFRAVGASFLVARIELLSAIRLLTIWHETPDMEEMVYLILEKALRGRLARRSKT